MSNTGRQKGNNITFDFKCVCADCDEAGRMVLKANETGTVGCPGGCGTVYCPWRGPDGKWRLKAVVVPVYGDPERDDVDFEYWR